MKEKKKVTDSFNNFLFRPKLYDFCLLFMPMPQTLGTHFYYN